MAVRTATFRGRSVGSARLARPIPVGSVLPSHDPPQVVRDARFSGKTRLSRRRRCCGWPTSIGQPAPTGAPRVPREPVRTDTNRYDALSVHRRRNLNDALSAKSKRCVVGPQLLLGALAADG